MLFALKHKNKYLNKDDGDWYITGHLSLWSMFDLEHVTIERIKGEIIENGIIQIPDEIADEDLEVFEIEINVIKNIT